MEISYEPLELGTRNIVWRQIITVPTNALWYIVHKSTITNLATERNFEVMSYKFNVDRVCIQMMMMMMINLYFKLQAVRNSNSTRIQSYDPLLAHEFNCNYC
jgi:hypothetical protein